MYGVLFLYKSSIFKRNKSIYYYIHTYICRYILAYKIFTISVKKKPQQFWPVKIQLRNSNKKKTIAYITTKTMNKYAINQKHTTNYLL